MKKSQNLPVWFKKMVSAAQRNCTVCAVAGEKAQAQQRTTLCTYRKKSVINWI
jgi:hypothetical protein